MNDFSRSLEGFSGSVPSGPPALSGFIRTSSMSSSSSPSSPSPVSAVGLKWEVWSFSGGFETRSYHFSTSYQIARNPISFSLQRNFQVGSVPIWEMLPQVLFPEKFRHPLQEDIGGCGSELWVLLKQVPDDLLELRGVRASDGSKLTAHYLKRKEHGSSSYCRRLR